MTPGDSQLVHELVLGENGLLAVFQVCMHGKCNRPFPNYAPVVKNNNAKLGFLVKGLRISSFLGYFLSQSLDRNSDLVTLELAYLLPHV
jgi:hypothetical protein